MPKRRIVRYYKGGWHHADLLKAGRKWAFVLDLAITFNKDRKPIRRRRRVPLVDVKEALWA